MAIVADTEENLQHDIEVLHQKLTKINTKINIDKTRSKIISKTNKELQGKQMEQVKARKILDLNLG